MSLSMKVLQYFHGTSIILLSSAIVKISRCFDFDDIIRSSHKFVPTFVYTFHVSIYKHTAIRDQCT